MQFISPNELLTALPPVIYERLAPRLQRVRLKVGSILFDVGATIDYTWFITSGIVWLLGVTEDGASVEVATADRDSAIGFHGIPRKNGTAFRTKEPIAGAASRVSASALQAAIKQESEIYVPLLDHTHTLSEQIPIAQAIVCSKFHTTDQRPARWLLLVGDITRNATIILLETGMRPMELFEMKRDQVVLSEGYIKAISYKTGKRRTVTAQPKTRIIPLTGRARAEIEKLLALSKDDNVFPYMSIKKAWASVCRTAGVQGFWFRWLRDEAENRWREAGMHPLDIAYLMGHASPRTTMIYNNPRREEIVRQMSAANPSKILAKTSRAAIADRS